MTIIYHNTPICSQCLNTMNLRSAPRARSKDKLGSVDFCCITPDCGQRNKIISINVNRAYGTDIDETSPSDTE